MHIHTRIHIKMKILIYCKIKYEKINLTIKLNHYGGCHGNKKQKKKKPKKPYNSETVFAGNNNILTDFLLYSRNQRIKIKSFLFLFEYIYLNWLLFFFKFINFIYRTLSFSIFIEKVFYFKSEMHFQNKNMH